MACRPTVTLTSLCFLLFIVTCSSSASGNKRSDGDSNKVSLALYYESLCPFSANFIVHHLPKLIQNEDLLSVVDLYLSPWGNAKLQDNGSFICQHGPYECFLNTVEACAIDAWPSLQDHFPFIYCVEKLVYDRKYNEWETCFQKLDRDPKPVTECFASGYGKKLELQYGAETDALQPPHRYVPWVVVNGRPLYEDYEDFINYICNAYHGTTYIKACSELSRPSIQRGIANPIAPVCYKETTNPDAASI